MSLFYEHIVGDVFDALSCIEDNYIDLVLTSPPYYQLRDYGFEGQIGLEKTPEEYIEVMGKVHEEIFRVLKPIGSFFLNISDSYGTKGGGRKYLGLDEEYAKKCRTSVDKPDLKREHKSLLMIPERVALRTKVCGFTLRNKIIWYKPNHLPASVKDRFACTYEYIYFFTKKHTGYTFNLDEVRVPIKDTTAEKARRSKKRETKYGIDWDCKEEGRPKDARNVKRAGRLTMEQTIDIEKGKNPGDMWQICTQPHGIPHVAIYPDELCERVIKVGTNKGDVVLDHFIGSGTTMLIAHKLGRSCIGIDGDERNVPIIKERIKGFTHTGFSDNEYKIMKVTG